MMEPQKEHNGERALRNWRVILDKLITLVILTSLQGAVRDWCPALLGSEQSYLVEDKPETVEDTYAYLIQEAKLLAPLKSKEKPMIAASNCIHHKTDLKAGGNGSASWIVCRACHSRSEMNYRAADLKKELKMRPEENPVKIRAPPVPKASSLTVHHEELAASSMQSSNGGSGQHGRRDEANGVGAERKGFEERSNNADDVGQAGEPTTRDEPVDFKGPLLPSVSVELHGNTSEASEEEQADLRLRTTRRAVIVVKKEGRGRQFRKCVQRRCNFFLWEEEPMANASDTISYGGLELMGEGHPCTEHGEQGSASDLRRGDMRERQWHECHTRKARAWARRLQHATLR